MIRITGGGILAASAVLLAACGAPVTGVGTATDVSEPEPTPAIVATPEPVPTLTPTVAWESCEDRFECATLEVPLDRAAPDGEQVELALIRLPAPAAARRLGSLIVNPGGPGASGVDFVRSSVIDIIPAELRARFDIVGFDPRGVGATGPVSCGDGSIAFLSADLAPDDDREVAAAIAAAESYAVSCADASGDVLPFVGTAEVARDLDAIREAVGDGQLTYVGYSYGTRIGAAYAQLFPDNVRALVLDGAVDPRLDLIDEVRDSADTLESALEEFLDACASDARCPLPPEYADLAAFDALMADLDAAPLPAPRLGPDQRLEAGQAAIAVLALLRDRAGWPMLEVALADAWHGDGSLLAATLGVGTDVGDEPFVDSLGPLMAVNCRDVPAPDPQELPGLVAELTEAAPRFGPLSLLVHAPCSFWTAPADPPGRSVSEVTTGPIVVVGNRGDLITPFAWSESLAEQLAGGVLLTRDGDRHTAFGGENVCTDRAVIRYLIELIPPDPTRSCG